jgi:chemotaxis protein MotC
MSCSSRYLAAVPLCALLSLPAHGAGGGDAFELVRSLRTVQDAIVRGDRDAHAAQRTLIATIGNRLAAVQPAHWKQSRNARAAVLFVLSGGSPRILRGVLAAGGHSDLDERLIKGALAYGEGRHGAAAEQLDGIDARTLEAGIGGHIALVQATLAARTDPAKASALLEQAQLLSPGTLVEEAALRRQILLSAAAGDARRIEALAARYMHRYPRSLYAGSLRRQLAIEVSRIRANEASQYEMLHAALRNVGGGEREELLLSVAQEAILGGRVTLARLAARDVERSSAAHEGRRIRSEIYQGAALIVTDDYEGALARLKAVERVSLAMEDAELLDAALEVASQIRRRPDESRANDPPPSEAASARARELGGIGERVISAARAIVTSIDAMLMRAR